MRSVLTTEDVKRIIEQTFNGNLREYLLSGKTITYTNENSEEVLLVEDDGAQTKVDLAEALNVYFYSWKNRLVEKGNPYLTPQYSTFDDWVLSLNFSMNESYCLVEITREEATQSQDIDNGTKEGKLTFLIQANKIKNIDYYVEKVRNKYLGEPQTIQNSNGDMLKAYMVLGALTYEQEPIMTALGECYIANCNFSINYLTSALTYSDINVAISFTGDDSYNADGTIIGETKYLSMPFIKTTWQAVFANTAVPMVNRPDLTGYIATSLSTIKTLSFYDFNQSLTEQFNTLFWQFGAYRKNGILTAASAVNVPVYIKITVGGNSYVYRDMIDNVEKTITNNDFNISSITLKGWGRNN